MGKNPKVFISYSHQDEKYSLLILDLANRLRSEGIDANIDLYEESPEEGWPKWMEKQIVEADFVLVVCSESYNKKFYSNDELGRGVCWEVNIVYQCIYNEFSKNSKFIPVFFSKDENQYIPLPLKSFTYYMLSDDEQYNSLYWRLRGIRKNAKPELGELRDLPLKTRRTMFTASPINIEKWDKAQWKGVVYYFPPVRPILGLFFENYQFGVEIFKEWKIKLKRSSPEDMFSISFITPPFPSDKRINHDKERNFGEGYFIHIGPNVSATFTNIVDLGFELSDVFLKTVSRFRWVDEREGAFKREMLQERMKLNHSCDIMPTGLINPSAPPSESNLFFDPSLMIQVKDIDQIRGVDVRKSDSRHVVFRKNQE